MTISEKYKNIQEQITNAALSIGRNPDEITLVAVSKGYSWDHVEPAYQAGCRNFGENRLQEALPKIQEAPHDIQWHFIGTLQKNKVNKVIGKFVLIHSVDTPDLAEKISQCSAAQNIQTRILLQVNTSGETSKHGFSTKLWRQSFDFVATLPGIKIEGLMTMAPYTQDITIIRRCFSGLRIFRDELALQSGIYLPHLSMGMTNDFKIAIEEGATILRVGSAIFSGT